MAAEVDNKFRGRHVLVVEDEYLIAEDLRQALEEYGVEVLGPVASVEAALKEIATAGQLDAATLDVTLGRDTSLRVAEALEARKVPFVLLSGYDERALPEPMKRLPLCHKPAPVEKVLALLFG